MSDQLEDMQAKAKMAMDLEEKLKDPVSEFRLDVPDLAIRTNCIKLFFSHIFLSDSEEYGHTCL